MQRSRPLIACLASLLMFIAITSSCQRDQPVTEEDCAILSMLVDSLARGPHLVISSVTAADAIYAGESDWRTHYELYGEAFDGAYGDWLDRTWPAVPFEDDCITTQKPNSLVEVTASGRVMMDGEAVRLGEAFPNGVVSIVYLTLPGYNARSDTAYVVLAQFCQAECGADWSVVLSNTDSWEIENVTGNYEY